MSDLRTIIGRISLTQRGAARLLDIDERCFRRRIAGQIDPRHVTWFLTAVAEIQARTGQTAETIIRRCKGDDN